jgi:hypothetical protein
VARVHHGLGAANGMSQRVFRRGRRGLKCTLDGQSLRRDLGAEGSEEGAEVSGKGVHGVGYSGNQRGGKGDDCVG